MNTEITWDRSPALFRAEVRAGHVHFIPRGLERFMVNSSKTEPLEVIGVLTGAGNLEEAGYVYTSPATM